MAIEPEQNVSGDVINLKLLHLPEIVALLQSYRLPSEDCYEHIEHFVGVFFGRNLVAVGGFEHLGKVGLLRSVAVAVDHQGQSLATRIVKRLQQKASNQGITALYLLIESAERYFLAHGYETLNRNQLPVEITDTRQFQSLCAATAKAMVIHLPADKF